MTPNVRVPAWAICFAIVCSASALGMIRRHDKPDEEYIAAATGYDSAVQVGTAMGTAISPEWILTAAHVGTRLSPTKRIVKTASSKHRVDHIVAHPTWNGEGSLRSIDLCLLHVSPPIEGIEFPGLYEWDDEVGKTVTFVGNGQHGTGKTGPQRDDWVMRAATNEVIQTEGGWMVYLFDEPPAGTELEGISGPGDSGGPAYIDRDGKRYLIGVSSSNDAEGNGSCRYGSKEYYPRVSASIDWIRSTIGQRNVPTFGTPEIVPYSEDALPKSAAGRAIRAFLAAYADGTERTMEMFEKKHRADAALADRSAIERAAKWMEYQRERWPSLVPKAFAVVSESEIELVTFVPEKREYCSFTFQMDESVPDRLSVIRIGPATAPD